MQMQYKLKGGPKFHSKYLKCVKQLFDVLP